MSNKKTLDAQKADELLKSIFEECEQKPNDVPLNKIKSKLERRHRIIFTIKTVGVILVVVVLLYFCSIYLSSNNSFFTANNNSVSQIVTNPDTETLSSPQVTGYSTANNLLSLLVTEGSSSIDYTNTYIVDKSGTTYYPIDEDFSHGTIVFTLPQGEINIYIANTDEQIYHGVLTPVATP